MGRGHQTDKQINGHRDSMKESAKGRFFENRKPYPHADIPVTHVLSGKTLVRTKIVFVTTDL